MMLGAAISSLGQRVSFLSHSFLNIADTHQGKAGPSSKKCSAAHRNAGTPVSTELLHFREISWFDLRRNEEPVWFGWGNMGGQAEGGRGGRLGRSRETEPGRGRHGRSGGGDGRRLTLGQKTAENGIAVDINAAVRGRRERMYAVVIVVERRGRGGRGVEEEAKRAALPLRAGGRGWRRGWRNGGRSGGGGRHGRR